MTDLKNAMRDRLLAQPSYLYEYVSILINICIFMIGDAKNFDIVLYACILSDVTLLMPFNIHFKK